MLVLEVFRYLKRRINKRAIRLSNFVSVSSHHGLRTLDPRVTIIIPTRDKYKLLRECIESIQTKTTYGNYEIMVINNGSIEASTLGYLKFLALSGVLVVDYPQEFNYSKITNFGAANTKSDYICLLNNDTQVIEPNWLGNLMDHSVQARVGVVGSKLLYPDGSLQHNGVAVGINGIATHFKDDSGSPGETLVTSLSCFQVEAVTFASVLIKKEVFDSLGGLDPTLKIGLNDIDFCLRINQNINVVCGRALLTHQESASRHRMATLKGMRQAIRDILVFLSKNPLSKIYDRFFE